MVAKVMGSGSSMASAIGYNEEKVREGDAAVIAEVNADSDHVSVLDTFLRLECMNIRSRDVSFHMSVNPHETERLSEGQVREMIGELMNGLGYGRQPYIIYRHDDIGRTHYHVVSIRTDHSGRKIQDRQEKKRCNELLAGMSQRYGFRVGNGTAETLSALGLDTARFAPEAGHVVTQMEAIILDCLSYRFSGKEQFADLTRSRGIELIEGTGPERPLMLAGLDSEGRRCTPPVDERSLAIPLSESLEARMSAFNEPRKAPVKETEKIGRICSACLPHAADLQSFMGMLDRKGITVVVKRSDEGKVTSMTFIDRKAACVISSSQIRGFRMSGVKALEGRSAERKGSLGKGMPAGRKASHEEGQDKGKSKVPAVKR